MKRIFHHPPAKPSPTGRKYWRSLGELNDTPEFRGWLEREFPAGAAEMENDGVTRRNFLQLMGASMALAGFGLGACRRPEAYLVPMSKSVEWLIPGKALFYATAMPRRRGAMPLIVTTHDGRPTKLEGNPLHPASNGATDTFAQCSLLDLYDPDRSSRFLENGKVSESGKFAEYLKALRAEMAGNGGADVAVFYEGSSPTFERLRGDLSREFPGIQWCVYDPLRPFNEYEAMRAAFGDGMRLAPRLDKADVILSLDSDFLHPDEGGIDGNRDWADRRRVLRAEDSMGRLYVVEPRYTLTGGMADHRLRCAASQIGALAVAVAQRVRTMTGDASLGELLGAIPDAAELGARFDKQDAWLSGMVNDLAAARGKGLVLAGPRQPGVVHLLVYALNAALGNFGNTLIAQETPGSTPESTSISQLAELIRDAKVKTLLVLGGNPAYNALANLEWPALQKQVPNVVHLASHENETTAAGVRWHVPMAHYLESWGDARGTDGTYVAIQPMILPLFGGWSELDVLAALLGREKNDKPDLVRDTFKAVARPAGDFGSEPFEQAWNKFLRDGFLANSAPAERPATMNVGSTRAYLTQNLRLQFPPPPTQNTPEVVLFSDYKMDDGRYINNGWLQEMPDPITKLTWDNAALMSPAMAKRLKLVTGSVIEVSTADGRKLRAPVWQAPGHVDNAISIALGYGRSVTGKVGRNVGVNAYVLRTAQNTYVVPGAKVDAVTSVPQFQFASTQEHQSMEGRNIVRELPLAVYQKERESGNGFDESGRSFVAKMGMDAHIPPNVGLYNPAPLNATHQWGMAIDLNTCTSCNACTVACQAENNIPIVGKEQVSKGRVMHWMRIDRYYSSVDEHDEDPEILHQPMLCQHCENAPCETVCPVNATVHNEEGLNLQAYNRCIGTRYCSNNCPYKVRRFNFFDYNTRPIEDHKLYRGPLEPKGMPEILKLSKNPNVTVRMRGVMEKCTFCIQRIEEAKIAQLRVARDSANTRVPTDSFKTACQQACPVEAIVFGDLNNPESKVSKVKAQDRDYKVLEYLNVRPRVSYQARLRNPNPAMPGAEHMGRSLLDQEHDPGVPYGFRKNEAPAPGDGL